MKLVEPYQDESRVLRLSALASSVMSILRLRMADLPLFLWKIKLQPKE